MEPGTDQRKTSRKPLFAVGGVAALALGAWLAFGFFGIQSAFIDETVDEGGPVFAAVAASETAAAGAQPATDPLTGSSTTTEGTFADQAAESTTTAAEPTTTATPATTEAPLVPDPTTSTTEAPTVADPSSTTTQQPTVEDPTTTTAEQPADQDSTTTTSAPTTTVAPTTTTTVAPTTTTTAAPTTTTPPAQPGEVVTTHSGNFSGTSRYDVDGNASVLGNGTSQRFVRFEQFESSNGPDLKVYLRSAGGAFVNLGNLKGNVGAQNYEIPADVDLAEFSTVEIWCERFSVGFGSAQLSPT